MKGASLTFEEETLLADCGVRKERQLGEFHQRVCDREREWVEGDVTRTESGTFAPLCVGTLGVRYLQKCILTAMPVCLSVPLCVCLASGGLFTEINAISDMPQSPTVCASVYGCGIILKRATH